MHMCELFTRAYVEYNSFIDSSRAEMKQSFGFNNDLQLSGKKIKNGVRKSYG